MTNASSLPNRDRPRRFRPRFFTPLYFPLPLTQGGKKVKKLHSLATRLRLSSRFSWKRKLFLIVLTLFWPIVTFPLAITAARRYRNRVGRRRDRSCLREALAAWVYSIHYLQPAINYFYYRLEEPENRRRRNDFLPFHEVALLLYRINPPEKGVVLRDKMIFWRKCREFGLPAVPVFAEVLEGEIQKTDSAPDDFPRMDLFLKPVDRERGWGAECLFYSQNGQYRDSSDRVIEASHWESYVNEVAGNQRYLIQPRIRNHKDLARFSHRGVCSTRVVTLYDQENGEASPLIAILLMPRGRSIIDVFGRAGLAAPIEMGTGILGKAVSNTLDFIGDRHPDTGEQIAGSVIPFWDQVMELCISAQKAFCECPTVGWDVAVTDDGPILVEGNGGWSSDVVQVPHNFPLGRTKFVDFLLDRCGN